jgi:hypothetical protein
MPHPYVDKATVANNKITLRVEVSDFGATGGLVEVTGQATQTGGALAIISATPQVPATPNGDPDDPKDKDRYFVDVTADAIPPHQFRKDQDVTVFVRVSRVWVTVLGEQSTSAPIPSNTISIANDGTTWDQVREDARITNDSWPSSAGNSGGN